MRRPIAHKEAGVALILVLSLISIMSAAAVFSFDSLSRIIQRNVVEQQVAQARHYAMAAEQISIAQMREVINDKTNFGLVMSNQLNRYDYTLDTATITVVARDMSNCFNVHGVVSGSNIEGHVAELDAINAFAALLQQFGIGRDAARGMSSALADWQDADDTALPLGAESQYYADQEIAYRTPNSPVRSLTELRLIRDFSPSLLEALNDLICIGAGEKTARLNVTTFEPQHAPLIAALLENRISQENLASFLEDNPPGRFEGREDFFDSGLLGALDIDGELKRPFNNYPSYVRFIIESRYGDAKLRMQTDVHFEGNGTYAIISRKFGV